MTKLTMVNGVAESATAGLDAIIIGAGFSGIYLLHQLRKEGLNVKIVEASHGLGGVWHQNSYPGARVDSPYPVYALNIPEVYKTWKWTEKYPGEKELKQYFRHIDDVLGISRDVIFNTRIAKATYDDRPNVWTLESESREKFTARFFFSCIGYTTKPFIPEWPGLTSVYEGQVLHSTTWPHEGINMKGKKVAIIGTGATGVQLAQEVASEAELLTCFIRTPNLTWPMRQQGLSAEQATKDQTLLPDILGKQRAETSAGFFFPDATRKVFEDRPEQRRSRFEKSYKEEGGFEVLLSTYSDIFLNQASNDELYYFWRHETHQRMKNARKAELLAPIMPPHPFGGKRVALEQNYYEQMDRDNVKLVDVRNERVTHLVSNGIVTSDGTIHEAEVIILATGFDAITGGFKGMEITGLRGDTLKKKWGRGTDAYLGMMVSGFPNFFFTLGPYAPTAYSNGPTVIEMQADWILKVMKKMEAEGLTRIDATPQGEREWREKTSTIHAMTLRDNVEGSWYLGLNIPGKKREPLNFAGGVPMYGQELQKAITEGWKDFLVG